MVRSSITDSNNVNLSNSEILKRVEPEMLWFMGSQRVARDLETE